MTATREAPGAVALTLPLRSDPPWLTAALMGLIAGFIGLFVLAFSRTAFPSAWGVLPGVMVGVFVGTAVAARARRRGATVVLEASDRKLDVRDPAQTLDVLDLAAPYSAVLLVDRKPGRRMLVVGQHGDPVVVLELGGASTGAPAPWADRTLTLDLESMALSPASPNVVALAEGHTLDALLAHLAPSVDARMPWVSQPTSGGATLQVAPGEVRYGARTLPLDATVKAMNYAVLTNGVTVAGLGLVQGDEGSVLLLACEDAMVERDAVTGNLSPDAYVPLAVFELMRAVLTHTAAAKA